MPGVDEAAELEILASLVGAPVVGAQRSGWGFENRTDVVTLTDGSRIVVQRLARSAMAAERLRLAALLPDRLAAVGVRVPRLIRGDAQASPPYAIYEYVEGSPASEQLATDLNATRLAGDMGKIIGQLHGVSVTGLGLPDSWADHADLLRRANQQLANTGLLLAPPIIATLAALLEEAAGLLAGRPVVFAHGDFCPVNALALDGQVVALIDLEYVRVVDPLFDAAWWGWVVRYHHPVRWAVAWPRLLAAASIPDTPATRRLALALQCMRCLEILDEARTEAPQRASMWARRLTETAGWV